MRKNAGKGTFVAPRNGHVAVVMTKCGAGAHQKTKKAIRRSERVSLNKMLRAAPPAMRVIAAAAAWLFPPRPGHAILAQEGP